jgi:hypothetical protein
MLKAVGFRIHNSVQIVNEAMTIFNSCLLKQNELYIASPQSEAESVNQS